MIFPALEDALLDRRLRRADLLVYGAILGELDPREPRPVRAAVVATATGIKPPNVRTSLSRLARLGYIARHGLTDGVRCYTFTFSRKSTALRFIPPQAA